MIIGISGFAGSGKDTAADILVEREYTKIAFADALRDYLYDYNPVLTMWDSRNHHSRTASLQWIIDMYGWQGYKNTDWSSVVRRAIQEASGRNSDEPNDRWITALFKRAESIDKLVISDVRYTDEADAIKARGGMVIRIERNGVSAVNNHISEHALKGYEFDVVVYNDGTLEEFEEEVRSWDV